MSDAPDRSEKQFDATPQRLQKAREDGQVARSRELASVGLLAAGAATLAMGLPASMGVLRGMTARIVLDAPTFVLTPQSVPVVLLSVGRDALVVVGPLFVVLMVVAVAANALQGGVQIATKAIQPKGSRISPMAGAKRLFSSKGLVDLGKAIGTALIVGPIAYVALRTWLPELMLLHTIPTEAGFATAGAWTISLVGQMLGALVVLAVADFGFQRWKHAEDLKMTRQEVKDEAKQSEGDPYQRSKRKQIARDLAMKPRLDHAVLKADVVVTNPTHFAVALRYAPDEGDAPVVLAKGTRKRALRIKTLAAELGVPTVENVPLARALFASVEEGAAIDEQFYAAVAAVLAEVYRTRGTRPARA